MAEKELFYLGSFSDVVLKEEGTDMYIKEAELFSVGTHRGIDYTLEDLQELVNNFDPADDVPLQYDHSTSAKDTAGFLRSVSIVDNKLMGTVEVLDDATKNRINSKLNRKLSISFMLKKTPSGMKPHKLREVSLVAFPQVKSARLFSEDNFVSTYEPKEFSQEEEKTMNIEEMKAQLKVELEQQYADQTIELAKLRKTAEDFTEMQVVNKVENFAAEKKIVPAQKDALKELLASFDEDQMAKFEEFMKSQKALDLDENGELDEEFGEQKKDKKTEDDLYYEAQAKRFSSKL